MFDIKNVDYYKSFNDVNKIPDFDLPEIAFIGRSNVGKSSLINHLCSKKIAETSSTPGRTRMINFFLVNKNIYFVDLPGYGYADASYEIKKNIQFLIESYLQYRAQLKVVFFLLDIRRTPNEEDKIFSNWLKKIKDIEVIYVLTKTDKLNKSEINKQKTMVALELFVDQLQIVPYSIKDKLCRREILKKLGQIFLR
jgi:GTP-binding protein